MAVSLPTLQEMDKKAQTSGSAFLQWGQSAKGPQAASYQREENSRFHTHKKIQIQDSYRGFGFLTRQKPVFFLLTCRGGLHWLQKEVRLYESQYEN